MFGLAGIALGIISGNKNSKNEKKANDQSYQIQKEQLDFAKDRFEQADVTYTPIENSLVSMALDSNKPRYGEATSNAIGDINTQFAGAEDARKRNMQRMGVNPNSGRADSMDRQLSLSRAMALAGGINGARVQERDRADSVGWERLYNSMTLGANKMNGTQNSLTEAQNSMAATRDRQADYYAKKSQAGYGMAGQIAGMGLSAMMGGM
jgi:hypothetical protein